MRRVAPEILTGFSLALFSVVLIFPTNASAASRPRIVLIDNSDTEPPLKEVVSQVRDALARLNVRVDTIAPASFPTSQEEWESIALEQSRAVAGTLAVFGWNCRAADNCSLFVVETRHLGLAAIPVRSRRTTVTQPTAPVSNGTSTTDGKSETISSSTEAEWSAADAMASVIRETVYGSLLMEMDRVSAEGENPQPPPPAHAEKKSTPDGADSAGTPVETGRRNRALFWLETGYIGEFPFPDDHAIHGVFFGAAMYPSRHVAPTLSLGWLGVRSGKAAVGDARTSLIPVEAAVRIVIPVGISLFSLAPTARMDMVISGKTPEGEKKDSGFDVDLLLGGMTYWNIPMPVRSMELLLGAGILATVIGHDVRIDDQVVLEKSTFRIVWTAGVTFGL